METVRPDIRVYGVAQINRYLKELILEDDFLRGIWLKGEISGYKEHSSGHIYFSLKEGNIALRSVMFRSYTGGLTFQPENGMEVMVYGNIALYDRDASCQCYVEDMLPSGAGAHAMQLEALKNRLAAEGLFDQDRKKPLPGFARRIAVVTAPEGAAWQDMQRVAKSRFAAVELLLFPSLVQGIKAADAIAEALRQADAAACDIIIVGRGGGSYEDLAVFDTETVVRAIAACQTPVISAVGHETDFSLADLAADLRAATPTHAAQIAVPDAEALREQLVDLQKSLLRAAANQMVQKKDAVARLSLRPVFANPFSMLEFPERELARLSAHFPRLAQAALAEKEKRLLLCASRLDLLSPASTLARGYALCTDPAGRPLVSVKQMAVGDRLALRFADGQADCIVEGLQERIEEDGHGQTDGF